MSHAPHPASAGAPPALDVLFEDEACLVVAKPSGLAAHRGLSGDADTLVVRLRASGAPAAHLVHRLDRGTSGAILVARTPAAARALGAEMEARAISRTYLALVRGAPSTRELLVDHPIPRDEGGPRVPAETAITTIAVAQLEGSPLREARYALLLAKPRTGRFHQVRRHCKHLGHPIAGDTTYGRSEHNRLLRERVGLARLALHAAGLSFSSPASGPVHVWAPLPADLRDPLARLGLGADAVPGSPYLPAR